MDRVRQLRVRDVRCYENAEITLGASLTVIYGANGAGKTNLLEALYFACTGRSCRTSNEREFVRFDQEAARVELEIEGDLGSHQLAVGFEPGQPRHVTADGGPVDRLIDVPFRPLVCVFLPDRLELIKGTPALRRDHLDQLVAGLWPARASLRRDYGQALAQRNALLARVRHNGVDPSELDTWDLELARHALALRAERQRAVDLVGPPAQEIADELGLPGGLEIRYRPRSKADDVASFVAELAERRGSDLERGFSGHGPHRDELLLSRDGRELRVYGSQGEQRVALLALLLAERQVLAQERGRTPLLLLDDVMSELDAERRQRLVTRITAAGQSVVTTTELDQIPGADDLEVARIEVSGGRITQQVAA
jgi:DNA replication and repair protein RecF